MARAPDTGKGRLLFAEKGCVLCRSVKGVGGTDAAALDVYSSEDMVGPLDFVANMWRGAPDMIRLQEQELGSPVEFSGEELGDIIGSLYSAEEQKKFTMANLPDKVRESLAKMDRNSPGKATPDSMNGMKTDETGLGVGQ